tara:strand:- start:27370 stop:27678 length:309 start_codon:yes stop_codon:yes gene_type:complete
MKTLFVVLIAIISQINLEKNQDTMTVKATFDGYEDGTYYFTDEEGATYEFQKIVAEASKKFNLTDEKFNEKVFNVTYKMDTELDENEEEYAIYTITDLKLIE